VVPGRRVPRPTFGKKTGLVTLLSATHRQPHEPVRHQSAAESSAGFDHRHMTELNRHKRAQDLSQMIARLENYREQTVDFDTTSSPKGISGIARHRQTTADSIAPA